MLVINFHSKLTTTWLKNVTSQTVDQSWLFDKWQEKISQLFHFINCNHRNEHKQLYKHIFATYLCINWLQLQQTQQGHHKIIECFASIKHKSSCNTESFYYTCKNFAYIFIKKLYGKELGIFFNPHPT